MPAFIFSLREESKKDETKKKEKHQENFCGSNFFSSWHRFVKLQWSCANEYGVFIPENRDLLSDAGYSFPFDWQGFLSHSH